MQGHSGMFPSLLPKKMKASQILSLTPFIKLMRNAACPRDIEVHESERWCCNYLELLCFQEIHNLQSKKTDVGELEREREEAMQRLKVSCNFVTDSSNWTTLSCCTNNTFVENVTHFYCSTTIGFEVSDFLPHAVVK